MMKTKSRNLPQSLVPTTHVDYFENKKRYRNLLNEPKIDCQPKFSKNEQKVTLDKNRILLEIPNLKDTFVPLR